MALNGFDLGIVRWCRRPALTGDLRLVCLVRSWLMKFREKVLSEKSQTKSGKFNVGSCSPDFDRTKWEEQYLDQCASLYSSCIDSYPVDLLNCYRLPIILVRVLQKRKKWDRRGPSLVLKRLAVD